MDWAWIREGLPARGGGGGAAEGGQAGSRAGRASSKRKAQPATAAASHRLPLPHPPPPTSLTQVVEAALLEDLGAGLEPDSLAKVGDAVALQQLGGDAAQGAQHGPAGVDHLQLAVAGKGLGVGGQAGGVPAVVTGELACGQGAGEGGAVSKAAGLSPPAG